MAKIYGKGQITIPKTVREASGLAIGDRVVVESRDGEVVIRRPRGVLEFQPPQTDGEALPWPDARRAARTRRSARLAAPEQR